MKGPYKPGTFKPLNPPSEWAWDKHCLMRGKSYRVIEAFTDADGDEHKFGEEWEFIMSMFNRLDDELTLCVRSETGEEWKIPLIWKPDEHQDIIDGFSNHVCEVMSIT